MKPLDRQLELDELLDKLIRPIEAIYSKVELDLLKDIAERLNEYDEIGGTLQWRIVKLNELGALNEQTLQVISKLSGQSYTAVKSAIAQVVGFALDMDLYDRAYTLGRIAVNPRNISMERLLNARYDEAKDVVELIQTNMINSTRQEYLKIIDKVYIETETGIKSHAEAVKDGIMDLAEKGISGATYLRKGQPYDMAIEPVVRRNILTTLVQSGNKVQQDVIKETGAKHIYVSQHIGARNKGTGTENHEKWQGQVYSTDVFVEKTGYGTMLGLAGINCRHSHYPYFMGISPTPPKKIDTAENARVYDLTQKQRKMERDIRKARKELEVAKVLEDEEAIKKANKWLRSRFKRINKLINENPELTRDKTREYIQK